MNTQTNEFLTHSQLAAARAGSLQKLHAELLTAQKSSPAGWHGSDDIQTLVGLGGQYLWAEDPLRVSQITFKFDQGHAGSQGIYIISGGFDPLQQGIFYCVPNNPAIGWASITLVPNSAPVPRSFIVAGMETDANWKIIILLLNKLGEQGPVQPPFSAIRMGE
jgi:hypothetical protein